MKLVEIFEYVLFEKDFDTQRVTNLIDKTTNKVFDIVDNIVDKLTITDN